MQTKRILTAAAAAALTIGLTAPAVFAADTTATQGATTAANGAQSAKSKAVAKQAAAFGRQLDATATRYDRFAARFTAKATTDTVNAAAYTAAATKFTGFASRARALAVEARAATTTQGLKAVRTKKVTLNKDAAKALAELGLAKDATAELDAAIAPLPVTK